MMDIHEEYYAALKSNHDWLRSSLDKIFRDTKVTSEKDIKMLMQDSLSYVDGLRRYHDNEGKDTVFPAFHVTQHKIAHPLDFASSIYPVRTGRLSFLLQKIRHQSVVGHAWEAAGHAWQREAAAGEAAADAGTYDAAEFRRTLAELN
ncbi:hypothetical protein BC936DRAFT_136663 [Jimgerdemannia flammicorona]|uniref:Uncharacterized protein n=1 Tax=Jimgerdemannia flammicorona TaxID=994334 RepID=A0A433DN08_9FUNG|nr:hypothetical protein BC936DRAFT_136663 [Jimgerdemannia flammicorona]